MHLVISDLRKFSALSKASKRATAARWTWMTEVIPVSRVQLVLDARSLIWRSVGETTLAPCATRKEEKYLKMEIYKKCQNCGGSDVLHLANTQRRQQVKPKKVKVKFYHFGNKAIFFLIQFVVTSISLNSSSFFSLTKLHEPLSLSLSLSL